MKKLILIIIFLFIVVYVSMIADTNSVIRDFKDVISGIEKGDVIRNSALSRYSVYGQTKTDVSRANIKIIRLITLHNFHKGFIKVKYSYERYDQNNHRINGSWNIYSTWYIEKINGKWVVVRIKEKP